MSSEDYPEEYRYVPHYHYQSGEIPTEEKWAEIQARRSKLPSVEPEVYTESSWPKKKVFELVQEEVDKARDNIRNYHESQYLKEAAKNDWENADMERVLKVRYMKKKKDIPRINNVFNGNDSFQEHFLNLGYSLNDFILIRAERTKMRNEFLEAIERARLEKEQCGCTIS